MTGVELATVAMYASIAGAAITAVSAISGAQAQSNAMKYNAEMAERNAQIARQNAAVEEAKQRRLTVLRQGAARANVGMAGVDLEGSPLDILEQNAAQEELDALTIRYKGELAASGFQADAALNRANASNAMTQGYLKAGSAILMGAGQAAGYASKASPSSGAVGSGAKAFGDYPADASGNFQFDP